MKGERDENVRELVYLKGQIQNNEQSVDNSHQMYMKCQSEIRNLEKAMEMLKAEKVGLKQDLELKQDEFSS